jgi:hypothetical protein
MKKNNKQIKKDFKASFLKMDKIYKVINRVQEEKKPRIIFVKDTTLSPMIENILNDLVLTFDKKQLKNRIRYKIFPNLDAKKTPDIELENFEQLRDELLEDGQIF